MPERRIVENLTAGISAAENAARILGTSAKQYAQRAASAGSVAVGAAADWTRGLAYPEDPKNILDSNVALRPFPGDVPHPEILSASFRSDVLLGLSAAGVISLEDRIVGATRSIFHDGLRHQELSFSLFGADYDAIHGWMDTVPGSVRRGGGILHRLQHGHDFASAAEVYHQHGMAGVLVWAQHVSQDLMTPTGVPFPVGAQRLASALVDRGIATSGKAALLVSFNVAELAAGFLTLRFALRLPALVQEVQRKRDASRLCAQAQDAWRARDIDGAIANYRAALAVTDGDPAIQMALGWAYAEMGRATAESFLAFRNAAEGLATGDRTIDTDGLHLNFRGVAYLLALAQAREVLSQDHLRAAWRSELDRMLQGALRAFERSAHYFECPPSISVFGHELEWRPRPLSAAANYYLAARLAHTAPFLSAASDAQRLGGLALASLERARTRYAEESERIAAVADRWRLELAPVSVMARYAA